MKTNTKFLIPWRSSLKKTMLLLTMFLGGILYAQVDGSTCDAPIVIDQMPFDDSGNTSTYGNNYSSSDAPAEAPDAVTNGTGNTSYLSGDDVVYSYLAGANGSITINTTNDDEWIGLWVFTGCPFESTVGYHTSIGGATREIVDLPVMAGETYYIVISDWSQPTDYTISITGTDVGDPPTCLKPKHLTLNSTSTDEAEISWTAGDDETQWEVIFGEAGFDVETEGESFSVNDDPNIQFTDLTPNTYYNAYVRAICSEDDESFLAGPLSFTTACIATDTPFIQDFEDVTTPDIPNCASLEVNSGNAWKTSSTTSYGFSGQVLMYGYHTSPDDADSWYFTQGINLETGVNYQISYQYGNNGTTYTEKLKVAYGTSANSSAMTEELADHDISLSGSEESEVTFTVDADGVYYFGFQAHSATNQYNLYLDKISIIELSECVDASAGTPEETELTVCAGIPFTITVNDASTEDAGISGLIAQWEASTDGGDSWTAIDDATTPSYVIEDGIEEPTDFRYEVTCTNTDETDISDVITVDLNPATECYCDATSTSVEPITRVVFAGIDNSSPAETTSDGYEDFTDIVAEVEAGETYTFTGEGNTNGNYEAYFTVWIDWNQDGVFETEEMYEIDGFIEDSDGTDGQQVTDDILVPGDAVSGETRMRVRKRYNTSQTDPCGSYTFGQTEDYTVNVGSGEPVGCPNPSDIVVADITADTAEVSWTAGGDETQWEVVYGETGFDQDVEGENVLADETFTTITDLDSETEYDVYVRSVCGEDDYSDWVGPESFTTEDEEEPGGSYCEGEGVDFGEYGGVENFSTSDGITNIDNQDIEDPTGYHNFTDMVVSQAAGESFTFTAIIDEGGYGDAGVAIYIDYNNDFEFDLDLPERAFTTALDGFVTTVTATITIPADTDPGNYRLRITSDNMTSSPTPCNPLGSMHDYTLTVMEGDVEDCEAPTDIEVTNVTETTADVNWTENADATQWEVIYGEAGFDVETEGVNVTVDDDPNIILTDLTAATSYDLYVKAVCDTDNESALTGPVNFSTESTECDIISDFPWTESFDESGSKECWTQEYVSDTEDWNLDATENGDSSVFPRTGAYMAEFRVASFGGEKTKLITPTLDLSSVNNPELEFYFANANWGSDIDELRVYYKTSASGDWVQIGDDYVTAHSSWTQVTLELPEPSSTYFIAFEGETKYARGVNLDDITVRESDSEPTLCENPSDIVVADITADTALISWTAGGDETQWEVVYGEAGFDPDAEGDNVLAEETSTTITDLDSDTEYDIYVRSVCGEDDYSDWVGPESFTTEAEAVEDCEAPTDVEVTNITDTTVDVSWTAGGDEMMWAVVYGETGFIEGEEIATEVVSETNYTITDLEPTTDYDVYVVAICDAENMIVSDQVGPITFTTDDMSVDSQEFTNFTYYPNPVENQLSLKAGVQIENVQVFNLLGQNVISVQPNSLETQINTDALQTGVYLMEVSINGSQKTFRVVKK